MAKRIDLRAYQESIASRLAAAQAGGGTSALLGFESGGQRWLVDLPAAGEVLPLPALSKVPLTRPWLVGLANVHGNLQAVIDFSLLCGGLPTPCSGTARLLRVGTRHGSNTALLVARVHGLKRLDTLFVAEHSDHPATFAWQGESFTDTQGRHWTRLELDRLLADPAFLDASLPLTD